MTEIRAVILRKERVQETLCGRLVMFYMWLIFWISLFLLGGCPVYCGRVTVTTVYLLIR